jgi:hypothetical protein
MTLKSYSKADDIPEGLRSEYKQSGSLWVPDLADDHPVLVLNKTLKQEKEVVEAKAKKLSADLDDALEAGKTSGVPRGQALVAKADAEDLPKYRALGSVDEVTTKVTEHGNLKESESKRQREDKQRLVAKELGYDNVDAFLLLPDHPDYDIRDGKDGKKSVIALVKDGDKVVEKPAQEYLESSPRHAPLLPALKVKSGVTVHGTSSTTTSTAPGEPFAWAKQFADQYSKQNVPTSDLATAFAQRSSG